MFLLPFFLNLDSLVCYNYSLISILCSLVLSFYCSAAQTWLGIAPESPEGLIKRQFSGPCLQSFWLRRALGRPESLHFFSFFSDSDSTPSFLHLQTSNWMPLKENYLLGCLLLFKFVITDPKWALCNCLAFLSHLPSKISIFFHVLSAFSNLQYLFFP